VKRRNLPRSDGRKMSRRTKRPGKLRRERHANGKSERSVRERRGSLVKETWHQGDGKAIQLLHLVLPPSNPLFPRFRHLLLRPVEQVSLRL